ncbi:MAG: hypothetical protein CMJ31_03240 [Phycisphaerae bacterium]|nr:hypothetical protein [Phycisphaerae bacterium]
MTPDDANAAGSDAAAAAMLATIAPPVATSDDAAFPTTPAVVALLDADGAVVTIAATGDARAFIARRATDTTGGAVTHARVAPCASMFEADCLFLELAALLTPESWRHAADRWRAWFVRLDPADHAPAWKKHDLRDIAGAPVRPETFIGPFPDKHAAARAGRAIDDGFDLCREPPRLAQAPNAIACPYKEMGRCPAPCDGSETMTSFRTRVASVLAGARDGFEREIEIRAGRIRQHATAMEFEQAAAEQDRVDAIAQFTKPSLRFARTFADFGVLAILPAGRAGWARVMAHAGGATRWWYDVHAASPDAALDAAGQAMAWAERLAPTPALDDLSVRRIGLVCSHLFSRRKSSATLMPISPPPDEREVLRAARKAAKIDADVPPPPKGRRATGSEPEADPEPSR